MTENKMIIVKKNIRLRFLLCRPTALMLLVFCVGFQSLKTMNKLTQTRACMCVRMYVCVSVSLASDSLEPLKVINTKLGTVNHETNKCSIFFRACEL